MPEISLLYTDFFWLIRTTWFLPLAVVLIVLLFTVLILRNNPDYRISFGFAATLNGGAIALSVLAHALILLYQPGLTEYNQPPFWARMLYWLYIIGPYLYLGTLLFTCIFVKAARWIWTILLVVLYIFPIVPVFMMQYPEVDCSVHYRDYCRNR